MVKGTRRRGLANATTNNSVVVVKAAVPMPMTNQMMSLFVNCD